MESTAKAPIEIVEASAGPLFDVAVNSSRPTRQSITLTLRSDAPAGPFGAVLKVRTSSVDQPLLSIPVFGTVADMVEVDPPVIILREDGTRIGTHRRVTIRAGDPSQSIRPKRMACDHPGVSAVLDEGGLVRQRHLFYLMVSLDGDAGSGPSNTTLVIDTDNEKIGAIQVPVIVQEAQ